MRNNRTLLLKLALITALLFGACNLPSVTPKEETPQIRYITATPRPTHTAAPAAPELPSDTPLPPPTETLPPPPPEPTSTPTVLFTVAVTFSPTPTDAPGVTVRIRNMSGGPVNLYRYELIGDPVSGKLRFLGWLEHGYYGIFQFPSMGEWKIRYCVRDKKGNDVTCQNKFINVTKEDQEFRVP